MRRWGLRRGVTTVGALTFALLFGSAAWAGPSPLVRYLLAETAEGRLLSRYLRAVETAEFRAEIEQRFRKIEALAEGIAGDRLLLEELASRELRINPELIRAGGRPGEIEFVRPGSGSPYGAAKRKLFAEAPADSFEFASRESASAPRHADVEKSVLDRVSDFFKEMRECVRATPPEVARKNQLRYMFTNLGISEAMTVGGYVVGAGSREVDWKNLPSDMIVAGFSSFVGSRMVMGQGTFLVRWLRMAGFGTGRSGVDAVIYYVTPFKDTHGRPVSEATLDRLEYNLSWNLGTSVIPVSMYALLSGLECIYPGGRMVAASTAIRLAQSAATSVVYFTLRNRLVGGLR